MYVPSWSRLDDPRRDDLLLPVPLPPLPAVRAVHPHLRAQGDAPRDGARHAIAASSPSSRRPTRSSARSRRSGTRGYTRLDDVDARTRSEACVRDRARVARCPGSCSARASSAAASGSSLQWWVNVRAFRIDVGGRPLRLRAGVHPDHVRVGGPRGFGRRRVPHDALVLAVCRGCTTRSSRLTASRARPSTASGSAWTTPTRCFDGACRATSSTRLGALRCDTSRRTVVKRLPPPSRCRSPLSGCRTEQTLVAPGPAPGAHARAGEALPYQSDPILPRGHGDAAAARAGRCRSNAPIGRPAGRRTASRTTGGRERIPVPLDRAQAGATAARHFETFCAPATASWATGRVLVADKLAPAQAREPARRRRARLPAGPGVPGDPPGLRTDALVPRAARHRGRRWGVVAYVRALQLARRREGRRAPPGRPRASSRRRPHEPPIDRPRRRSPAPSSARRCSSRGSASSTPGRAWFAYLARVDRRRHGLHRRAPAAHGRARVEGELDGRHPSHDRGRRRRDPRLPRPLRPALLRPVAALPVGPPPGRAQEALPAIRRSSSRAASSTSPSSSRVGTLLRRWSRGERRRIRACTSCIACAR